MEEELRGFCYAKCLRNIQNRTPKDYLFPLSPREQVVFSASFSNQKTKDAAFLNGRPSYLRIQLTNQPIKVLRLEEHPYRSSVTSTLHIT